MIKDVTGDDFGVSGDELLLDVNDGVQAAGENLFVVVQ